MLTDAISIGGVEPPANAVLAEVLTRATCAARHLALLTGSVLQFTLASALQADFDISSLTVQAVLELAGHTLFSHQAESLLALAEHVLQFHIFNFALAHSILLHLSFSTANTIGCLSFKDTLLTCEDRA